MFEKYYEMYMKNMVALSTLEKLVEAERLTREQVDGMVADRLAQQGY